jgi:purine-nucleoside/S-methyl-5'-thioadenosine phosphorylase / adenosine deaminase
MMLTSQSLDDLAAVRHGFFTRDGGVSEGLYASLNCGLGSGDHPERVRENRSLAMRRLGLAPEALVTAYQVHSARVAVVEAPWPAEARPQVDGMVTRSRGVALGILTADCAPVLLADPRAGVIGAAHAGWRGAKSGILAETVMAMLELGARVENIDAAVGPCIRHDSYEVGPEFRSAFVADEPATANLFRRSDREGHFRFDLAGYVAGKLSAIGIKALSVLPYDTFADTDRFFSYRRVTLAGGGGYGRLLSTIALAP